MLPDNTSTTSERIKSNHVLELDSLRGIAIAMVVLGHGIHIHKFNLLAVCGVGLFFVLSGFLITRILLRSVHSDHYFSNFYIRRSLRIWPLYYLILLVAFCTPLFHFSYIDNPPYRFFLYIQNFWSLDKAPPILGTTWSLAIEEQFYLAWPLLVFLLKTPKKVGWAAIALIIAIPVVRVFYYRVGIDPYALTFGRLDGLATGALLAVLSLCMPNFKVMRSRLLKIFFAISIALLPLLHWTILVKALKDTSINFFFCGIVLFALSWRQEAATAVLRSSVLRFFGKISYCAYLVHLALIYKLNKYPVGVAFIATIVISTISWYAIESPILFLKDRFTRVDAAIRQKELV